MISSVTPEYEPPARDYSNGLCYIPPRIASKAYGHGIGRYYWGGGMADNIWRDAFSIRRVQADRSTPSMAFLLANNGAHGLHAAFYARYGSPHLLTLVLWLGVELHHRKRNINCRKHPKYYFTPRRLLP
eukprot:6213181-Pleurochrysis_carterae.AAC.2